jgi:hypothetical protein
MTNDSDPSTVTRTSPLPRRSISSNPLTDRLSVTTSPDPTVHAEMIKAAAARQASAIMRRM